MSEPRVMDVLLVEDNPGDADLTRETLEAGVHQVHLEVVEDGVEALEVLRGGVRPDLILLDLNLPRKGGREVLKEIKEDEELQPIPVVVLTSSESESDIAVSYALGANCYLTKPVDLRTFQWMMGKTTDFWFSVVRLPRG